MQVKNNNRVQAYARTTVFATVISLFILLANVLAAGDIYEAETATLNGAVAATNAIGFSGSGFVDYINSTGDYIEWSITTPSTESYNLKIKYALSSGNRPLAITVNGVHFQDLDFIGTGNFSTWDFTDTLTIELPAGTNQIRATAVGSSGANIDFLEVTAVTNQNTIKLEAETAVDIYGSTVASNQAGFSGTGFVDYADATGSYVEWEIDLQNAGDYSILFGYALAYGDRPLSISVNGNIVQTALAFPTTGSFTSWEETTAFNIALNSGVNTIRATAIGSSGANVDYLSLTPISNATVLEAENAVDIYGSTIASNQAGFSGTGFVDYADASGAYVEWEIDLQSAGDYSILFGYALAYGDRPLSISVNGNIVQAELSFPATGSFTSWAETVAFTITLNSGINTIRATSTGLSGANIDYLKLLGAGIVPPPPAPAGTPIIIDTDMMTDCDDTGALAVAHALADNGELNILGVVLSTQDGNNKHGNVVSAINYYYNRPNIPIGIARRTNMSDIRWELCPFSVDIYNNFPHDGIANQARPDAVTVYRQLLHDANDGSVVIAVIGHFYNIEDLLKSPGDAIDARNGYDLVVAKVKELIVTGGWMLPENRGIKEDKNFGGNTGEDAAGHASDYVFENWPQSSAKIIISGADLGDTIITGPVYKNSNTPMEIAYIKAYNGIDGRPSWDQTAILLAARGTAHNGITYWNVENSGYADVNYLGQVFWQPSPDKNHEYLLKHSAMSDADLAVVISGLMGQAPATP